MNKEDLIKHYWDCASALKPETHTHKLLKSYYMTICRKLAKSSIFMPKEKFSRNMICRHCSSKWNESDFQMKLKPQQIAYSTKARKQIEKLYDAKNSIENRRSLTRKQRKRAKWLNKRVRNSMEIKCELCQHKTILAMPKPNRKERDSKTAGLAELEETILPETVTPVPVKIKKKKNKNKDKTAGLKLEKVQMNAVKIALNKDNTTKPDTNAATKATNVQKGAAAVLKPQPNKSANKADATKKQAKPPSKLSQPLKAKKKTKNAKATAAAKVQSKTQQQNSLLQLAAMLKAQTSKKSSDNLAHKRLESLLK